MKLNKYQALDKTEIRNVFLDYIDALNMPVIDYVAIGIQDTIHKTSSSIMSSIDWQKTFQSQNLAEHDPVRKASFNTNSKIFSFDELDYRDCYGKEVMRQRKLHGIENGIVLMRRNLGYNFILTLATGFKNFHPYKYLIDNQISINLIFNDLIAFLEPSTRSYQLEIINHLTVDAKL